MPVVRAHVDPGAARRERREHAVRRPRRPRRRRAGDGQAGDRPRPPRGRLGGEPPSSRPRPRAVGRAAAVEIVHREREARHGARLAARWPPRRPTPTKPTLHQPSGLVGRRQVELVAVVGCRAATSSSSSTPRPGSVGGITKPSSQRIGLRRISAWKPPSARSPRGSGSSGCTWRAGCWRRRRRDRSRGAARSGRSAPRPCRRSSSPRAGRRPARGSSCRIAAAPVASTRANSYLVVRRSPVAIGIVVRTRDLCHLLRATRAAPAPRTTAGRSARAGARAGSRRPA